MSRPLHSFKSLRGRAGSEWMSLRSFFKRIGFYRLVVDQQWTTVLIERTIEHGIQVGHFRFGFSRTYCVWHDVDPPMIVKGFHR